MGFMDMFGKKSPWVDCNRQLTNIAGKLAGPPRMTPEGDFSVGLIPEDPRHLLNRNQVPNPNGQLELKVKVVSQYRQAFLDAVQSMAGRPVFATGVLLNDDSQGGRALIQPLDMLYAPLASEAFPGWFKELQKSLKDPAAVSVYRFAAATDASKSAKPPRSEETRTSKAVFPYPAKPNLPMIKIDFEIRKIAALKSDFQLNHDLMRQKIEAEVTVEGSKAEGPGVLVGDFVAYWANA